MWQTPPQHAEAAWHVEVREALTAAGVLVRPSGECADDACLLEGVRALGASAALRVSVGEADATVELLALDGRRSVGAAPIGDEGVGPAVVAALHRAEAVLAMGARAELLVEGTPSGALVVIDGAPAGYAPVRREVSAGAHSVTVRSDGFGEHREDLVVAAGEVEALRYSLLPLSEAGDGEAQAEAAPASSGEVWSWVVGGTLAVAGGLMIGTGMRTLAKDGDCVGRMDAFGGCTERVEFGAQSSVLLGVGTLALAGGILVIALEPFTVGVRGEL